jgi:major membrane immunogen (membrane-anchored lipoprotein)
MNSSIKVALVVAGVLLTAALAFAGYMTIREHQYSARIVELQNQVAQRDKTIEVQEGVYQRLTQQSKDLDQLLKDKDAELTSLRNQLKKQGSELLTANTLIVKLRKDLQDARDVPVVAVDPAKPGVKQVNIDTNERFDPFQVTGKVDIDCDTSKAHYDVKLSQRSPIRFSVIVSQDKDGTWRSSATSSTKLFDVEIALAGVNPYLLEEKWYEKLSVVTEFGVGTNPGILAAVGADFEIGKFDLGPRVWAVVDTHSASPYFGLSFGWHPFRKVR